jgi:hypothetical protein
MFLIKMSPPSNQGIYGKTELLCPGRSLWHRDVSLGLAQELVSAQFRAESEGSGFNGGCSMARTQHHSTQKRIVPQGFGAFFDLISANLEWLWIEAGYRFAPNVVGILDGTWQQKQHLKKTSSASKPEIVHFLRVVQVPLPLSGESMRRL